jgi:hypothetical protein
MPTYDNNAGPRLSITPELVRRVADLVYQQWVRDLQDDHERARIYRAANSRGRQTSRRTPGAGR